LSYTSFEYSDIKFDKNNIGKNEIATVSCKIRNTGDRDGDEVAQLYIHDILASVARPVMELKGFQRVYIKAGETKEISFAITPGMLSMLNEKMEWTVEPGDFRIMIGASSRDLRLKDMLTIK
jgi:beta-glucosidase